MNRFVPKGSSSMSLSYVYSADFFTVHVSLTRKSTELEYSNILDNIAVSVRLRHSSQSVRPQGWFLDATAREKWPRECGRLCIMCTYMYIDIYGTRYVYVHVVTGSRNEGVE